MIWLKSSYDMIKFARYVVINFVRKIINTVR